MNDTNKKIIGMKLVTYANFKKPISMDEFKNFHDDFMVKVNEIHHDVFNENCPKGCSGISIPIYEGEENNN